MSEPYDHAEPTGREADRGETRRAGKDLEEARENVFEGWPSSEDVVAFATRAPPTEPGRERSVEPPHASLCTLEPEPEPEPESEPEPEPAPFAVDPPATELHDGWVSRRGCPSLESPTSAVAAEPFAPVADRVRHGHVCAPGARSRRARGAARIRRAGGVPDGTRRSVGIVVSRFNGEITSRLLASALDELESAGVPQGSVTVMPVPGAFELPIGAMALARTRRFACIVALGCVIRGDTPHFDYVASEAASGLQLAALETGVPVSFGVLTLDRADQAEAGSRRAQSRRVRRSRWRTSSRTCVPPQPAERALPARA